MKEYMLDPPEPYITPCPVCGSDTYERIVLDGKKVIGCDDCLSIWTAEEWWEDLNERAEDAKYSYEENKRYEKF